MRAPRHCNLLEPAGCHKVQRLPRNLHFKVHKALRPSRNLHVKVHKKLELAGNLHFKVRKVLGLAQSLHFKVHKILYQSIASATKSALQGPQSIAPATKCTLKVHKVLHLPRFLKMGHMSKSHDSLPIAMSKVLRLPQNLHINIKLLRSPAPVKKSRL